MRALKSLLAAVLSTTIAIQPVLAQDLYFYRFTKSLSSSGGSNNGGGGTPGNGGNSDASVAVPSISGRVGHNLNVLAQASGLAAPITWSKTAGVLPNGLTLDQNGAIFGTPYQAGTFQNIQVKGVGSDGTQAVSPPFNVVIAAPLVLNTLPTLNARVGASFVNSFGVTGQSGPVTWNVTTDAPGLQASSFTLSGKPTAAGDYTVNVVASDTGFGGDTVSGSTTIHVTAPSVTVGLNQSGSTGQPMTFHASASNTVGTVTWKLLNQPSGMTVAQDGTVSWTPSVAGDYTGIVVEADCSDGSSAQSAPITVHVVNGIPDLVFDGYSPSTVYVASGAAVSVPAPQATGGKQPYSFSIAGVPGLTIDASTGAVSGAASASGTATVTLTDAQPVTKTTTLNVTVNQPLNLSGVNGSYSATSGTVFSGVTPSASGGRSPLTFELVGSLPSGLTFSSGTGEITGTPSLAGTVDGLVIKVKDANNDTKESGAFSIAVADAVQIGGYASSYSLTVGQASPSVTPTVSGGAAPITVSFSGTKPAGISVSNGVISGTPTEAGSFAGTITATDKNGSSASASVSWTVAGSISIASYGSAIQRNTGEAISVGPPSVSGGTTPYTFAKSGTWPAGLELSGDGTISGSISAPGNYSVAVKVTDAAGASATSASLSIGIYAPIVVGDWASSAYSLTQGTAASIASPGATGGTGSYSWQLASGALPHGMTVVDSTGAVTGTPDETGSFTVTVSATDGTRTTASSALTLVVAAPLSPGSYPQSAYALTSGQDVSIPAPTTAGGTTPYTFSLNSGNISQLGLTLNADGSISGHVPGTAVGKSTVAIVRVADVLGRAGNVPAVSFSVEAPLAVAGWSSPSKALTQNVAASVSAPVVSGGKGPYAFSIASGALPTGLSLNADGSISGTPSSANQQTSVVLKVTDADAREALSGTLSFDVRTALTIAYGQASYGLTQDQPATIPAPTVTGGDGAYSFYISSSDHRGMHVNADGSLTGTPTPYGDVTLTVQVNDAGQRFQSTSVTLHVAPVLQVSGYTSFSFTAGQTAVSQTPSVAGGTSPYSYDVASGALPSGLSLDSATGKLTGSPTEAGTFKVRITDAAGATAQSSDVAVTYFAAPAWAGSYPSTIGFTVGVANGVIAPSVTGGKAPLTYAWASGTRPTGLTLSAATGAISWASPATAATVSNLSVRVTDADGVHADSNVFSVVVSDTPTIGSYLAKDFQAGSAIAIAKAPATGGTAPLTYQLANGTSTPAGVTLNADGTISGSTSVEGAYSFQVSVKDANGVESNATTVSLGVWDAPVLSVSSALPSTLYAGQAITPVTVSTTGGKAPRTLSYTGTLPHGLAFDAASGTLSGTPDQSGAFSFAFKATEASQLALAGSSGIYSGTTLSVLTQPVYAAATGNNAATSGAAKTYTPTTAASGGAGSFAYSLVSADPAAALTIDATNGKVTVGSAAAAGAYTVTVHTQDGNGVATADTSFHLQVNAAPTAPAYAAATGASGATAGTSKNFAASTAATGGTGTLTYVLINPPAGFSIVGSNGTVIATSAATAGSYSVTVAAKDANQVLGQTATLAVDVNPGLTAPAYAASATVTTGQSADVTLNPVTAASGGTGALNYAFAVAPSSPMSGSITVNSSTGVVTATKTLSAGTYTFSVKATDANGIASVASNTVTVTVSGAPTAPSYASTATFMNGTGGTITPISLSTGGTGAKTYALSSGPNDTSIVDIDGSTGVVTVKTSAPANTYLLKVRATDTNGVASADSGLITVTVNPALTVAALTPTALAIGQTYNIPVTASGGSGSYSIYALKVNGVAVGNGATVGSLAGLTWDATNKRITGTLAGTATNTASVTAQVQDSLGNTATTAAVDFTVGISVSAGTPSAATVGTAYTYGPPTAQGGSGSYVWSVTANGNPVSTGQDIGTAAGVGAVGLTWSASGQTNKVTGTPTSAATITLVITATSGTQSGSATVQVVSSAALANSNSTLPYLYAGFAANCSNVTLNFTTSGTPCSQGVQGIVTGGRAPYVYAKSSGTLPTGVTINSDGTLAGSIGTASTVATYAVTVLVTDADGRTFSRSVNLIVLPGATFSSAFPTTMRVGTAITSITSTGYGSSSGKYQWGPILNAAPTGITIASIVGGGNANGSMSGTPTTAGTYTGVGWYVNASDGTTNYGTGLRVTLPTITVYPALTVAASPSATQTLYAGTTYTTTLTATGVSGTATWSKVSGTLPVGMSAPADGTTGTTFAITGTPTATQTATSVTYQVTDSADNTSKQVVLTYTVNGGVTVAQIPGGTQSTAYTYTVAATGGTGTYSTYVLKTSGGTAIASGADVGTASGQAAIGVTWNPSTHILSGTPVAGSAGRSIPLTLEVTDNGGNLGTASTSFAVAASALTATSPNATFLAGVDASCSTVDTSVYYAASCKTAMNTLATGGRAPYTITFNSGTLPTGATFNAGGALSGTVSVPAAANATGSYTYKVVDADNRTVTGGVNWWVAPTFNITQTSPAGGSGWPSTMRSGQAYTFSVAPQGSPTGKYSVTTTSLTSFSMSGTNAASFNLTGTPSGSGSQSFGNFNIYMYNTGTSANMGGQGAMVLPAVTVLPAMTASVSGNAQAITLTKPISTITMSVTGVQSSASWALTSGSMPTGLTLSGTTGNSITLTGTPTQSGSFSATYTVTDSYDNYSKSVTVTLTVNTAPTAPAYSTTSIQRGVAGNATVTTAATGGTGSLTYSIVGTPPSGFSMSGTSVAVSTSAARGAYYLQVQATDSQGITGPASAAFLVAVYDVTTLASSTTFTVPSGLSYLSVTLNGGGGGGGDEGVNFGYGIQYDGYPIGHTGGTTSVTMGGLSLVAGGGGGGGSWGSGYGTGASGTASGGDTNTAGGGAAGGAPSCYIGYCGYYGGAGGRVVKTWGSGNMPAAGGYSVTVGAGGTPTGSPYGGSSGGAGSAQFVYY